VAQLSILGGFLVVSADFTMAMFNPAVWTVPWYIIVVIGYVGFILVIPFLIGLYRRLA
jgi:hypothetical protein